jgi:hypothetical protein
VGSHLRPDPSTVNATLTICAISGKIEKAPRPVVASAWYEFRDVTDITDLPRQLWQAWRQQGGSVVRRFPPPWSVEELDACFVVTDSTRQRIAYVHFEDDPERRSAAKLLSRDEALRIAGRCLSRQSSPSIPGLTRAAENRMSLHSGRLAKSKTCASPAAAILWRESAKGCDLGHRGLCEITTGVVVRTVA